jgi:MoaA/NifB/PqqE/SkfB family radical SAM enzyme
MKLSAGIGLTNDCNLNCAHCYRDTACVDYLSLDQIKTICENLPIAAMGFGTGESGLHPQLVPIVDYLHARDIKLSVASNGYTLTTISDETLRRFHDVEVSIDFATEAEQDTWRGAGNWALTHRAIERSRALGVPVSILATMMSVNFNLMDALVQLARKNGVNLRVNAYQAIKTNQFRLTYEQFWEGYRRLFAEGYVVSCTEPVVRAVMGLGEAQSPCGQQSIRFNPRGEIIPCVYWDGDSQTRLRIADLMRLGLDVMEHETFLDARRVPASANACLCRGGCASRRALNHALDAHDEYCPWVRSDASGLKWQPAPAKDLMRSGNVCTTIVE